MRKEGVFLENRIYLPLIGRKIINFNSVEKNFSPAGRFKAANNPEGSGFSTPTGPKEGQKLVFSDIKIDVV
jgi:hypothetical protein